MNTFRVNITKIIDIQPHPDTETISLEIAKVYGWEVVVKKGNYSVGDKVLYIPIDSILPEDVERKIFPPDSKITLKNSRVRATKIRKFVSQGLIAPLSLMNIDESRALETDVSSELGITKYEPPENPALNVEMRDKKGRIVKTKTHNNPYFYEYGGLTHLKNHNPFKPDEEIFITEKIHGSNSRCGWLKNKPRTFFDKIKSFFGLFNKWQFCYGSNRVQLQSKKYSGYYSSNIYFKAIQKYELDKYLPKGYILYYEIYGPTIQKNYHYGLTKDNVDIVVFDVAKIEDNGERVWLNFSDFFIFMEQLNSNLRSNGLEEIKTCPVLYYGKYVDFEHIKSLTVGNSEFVTSQKIREGVVVRNIADYSHNRKACKVISDEYLLKDNTDFH